jgi:hypothetical protein
VLRIEGCLIPAISAAFLLSMPPNHNLHMPQTDNMFGPTHHFVNLVEFAHI